MIFRRKTPFPSTTTLPIALCDTFQLVLLLDGVGVAASLCSVDQLFSEALSNALDVSEGSFTGTDGEKGNGLIDTAERETSTACLRTVPALPIRVLSSRGPQLTMASTAIWMGF